MIKFYVEFSGPTVEFGCVQCVECMSFEMALNVFAKFKWNQSMDIEPEEVSATIINQNGQRLLMQWSRETIW